MKAGDRIIHKTWGAGTILHVYPDTSIKVLFDVETPYGFTLIVSQELCVYEV
jgi:hypothetical protein